MRCRCHLLIFHLSPFARFSNALMCSHQLLSKSTTWLPLHRLMHFKMDVSTTSKYYFTSTNFRRWNKRGHVRLIQWHLFLLSSENSSILSPIGQHGLTQWKLKPSFLLVCSSVRRAACTRSAMFFGALVDATHTKFPLLQRGPSSKASD